MCEYCEPKPLKWAYRFYFGVKANGKPRHALKNVSVNYCPMCGRKLNQTTAQQDFCEKFKDIELEIDK